MSYILDALKKAQQDRAREGDIDFEDITNITWDSIESDRERPGFVVIIVFSITILALLIYFIYERNSIELDFQSGKDYSEIDERMSSNAKGLEEKATLETSRDSIAENFKRAPDISVTGSIYMGDGAPGNKIFIGDRAYREGDLIYEHWVLFLIGEQTIELRSGDSAYLINY
jgi:hypothetical protein